MTFADWLEDLGSMFIDLTPDQMLIFGGAFVAGWIVAKVGTWLGNRFGTKKRDPRDDRIRSMEAEGRIAGSEIEKLKAALEEQEKEIAKAQSIIEEKDDYALKQTGVIEKLNRDLKDSVKKTRELREELTVRATENLRSEVKLREVETELSVAQASSDMIATGVLDFDPSAETEEDEDEDDNKDKPEIFKSAT